MNNTLLVVGAQPHSLGAAVARRAQLEGFDVVTSGVSGWEDSWLDLREPETFVDVVRKYGLPDHVVCTVGINQPTSLLYNEKWIDYLGDSFIVNAVGPLSLLGLWIELWKPELEDGLLHHFAAVSSNSAHIARSNSLAYCTSKAALSMGIRVIGREVAKEGLSFSVYAYEPGWLDGTPMSQSIIERLQPIEDLHRIPGGGAINVKDLAKVISHNLTLGPLFNGCTIRVDGGEQ